MSQRIQSGAVLLSAGAVEAVLIGQTPASWATLAATAPAQPVAERAGALLAAALVLIAVAAWTYALLVLALTALATQAHGDSRAAPRAAERVSRLLVPTSWRSAALVALGLVVTVGAATPATGDASQGRPEPPLTRLDGLPLPDRPAARVARPHHHAPPVIVETGDTLWDIAAAALPVGADDARIDRTWRAWYAVNRRVIGPDPDLLHPGQRLGAPARAPGTEGQLR